MDRRNAFSISIDSSKLTAEEIKYVFDALAKGWVEMSYSNDGTIWVTEGEHDAFVQLVIDGKAAIKANPPLRYVKDPKGYIEDTEGNKYRIAGDEDFTPDAELYKDINIKVNKPEEV